ncbi:MAG: UvrD-helicase domain-containing protein [Deltaproteobacteria bacterium]
MSVTPKIAISDDFLTAYARLPKAQQKKARTFLEKFRRDPTSSAINYERIHDMADDRVRTVRIDQTYRAVILHPRRGDIYTAVWVDHHDEAMDWAKRKRFEVNPASGALQVFDTTVFKERPQDPVEADVDTSAPASIAGQVMPGKVPQGRLFAGADHEDLVLLGVPAPMLASVRALRTEADLAELLEHLPSEACYALIELQTGKSPQEVLDALDREREAAAAAPDPDDLEAAVTQPEAQQHFVVVESDEALQDILARPLDAWRVFLHPTQRKVVERDSKGPSRVLGGAGTGKTVVAMHRARYVARGLLESGSDRRVLVTTFTKNLAQDIAANLDHLCSEAERGRIDVMNLHQWANQYLRAQGVRIALVSNDQSRELWARVVGEVDGGRTLAFYRDEWDHVVQAEDVLTRAEYFSVSRKGRGTPLSRRDRAGVWKVFEAYRAELDRLGKVEQADVIREARLHLEKNPGQQPYASLVADETQDFRAADLRLLRAIVPEGPNDLFLVGDAHQRIYRYRSSLAACGISVRGRRSSRLRINYRTTDAIRRFAVSVLEGVSVDDLDDGQDTLDGYRSLRPGTAPQVEAFASPEAEAQFIVDTVRAWLEAGVEPRAICLGVRTHDLIEGRYLPMLSEAGLEVVEIKTDADAALGPGVRVATMHRMKGLEFSRVLLAAVNDGTVPLRLKDEDYSDAKMREEWNLAERSLFHVASTRARDQLVVTSFGKSSQFVGA